jgi:hypothetical protein
MATAASSSAVKIKGGTFAESTHSYFSTEGILVPSVTQTLAAIGLVDFSRVKPSVLERKRNIGIAVHAATEYIDTPEKGELNWDSVATEAVGFVLAYESFCEQTGFRPTVIEHGGIAVVNSMAFGYRIDRFGTIGKGDNRASVILDIKCGCSEGVSWPLQLAGYAMIPDLPKPVGVPEHLRVALQLKKDGTFKTFSYDSKYDARLFLSALSLTHYKMLRKIEIPRVPDDIEEGLEDE